jgi:hypothetical protein
MFNDIANKVKLFSFQDEKSSYPVRDSNGNHIGTYGHEITQMNLNRNYIKIWHDRLTKE